MVNSAHIISLAALLQHAIAGHHFHAWLYVATWCVTRSHLQPVVHVSRAGCFVLTVAQRAVTIRW